eukprot:5480677-Alexandrium_andersonii.AAC.1
MGVHKWVAAFPVVSCACPGGCHPPDHPLRPRGATAPPGPPRRAPPAPPETTSRTLLENGRSCSKLLQTASRAVI